MILAVDIMGFENEPIQAIKACRKFCFKNNDVQIILVGDEKKISPHLKPKDTFFKIHHAPDIIHMDDTFLNARHKTNSSMYQAINLVKENLADGVLSAGNTSCYVFLTTLLLKRINHVNKISFVPYIPVAKNVGLYLMDVGANIEVSPNDFLNFARLCKIYLQKVKKILDPKIGIINIGTEANKGLDLQKNAHQLFLKQNDLNYVGFVEPRYLLDQKADILLIDGFSGNLILKTLEGSLKSVFAAFLKNYQNPLNWLAFLFSIPLLKKIKKQYDYKNNAGAIVIGLQKIAVKTHGSADYLQFYSSLRLLRETINSNLITHLTNAFDELKHDQ